MSSAESWPPAPEDVAHLASREVVDLHLARDRPAAGGVVNEKAGHRGDVRLKIHQSRRRRAEVRAVVPGRLPCQRPLGPASLTAFRPSGRSVLPPVRGERWKEGVDADAAGKPILVRGYAGGPI